MSVKGPDWGPFTDLPAPDHRPRLADGVELVGEFEGSGSIAPGFLLKKHDGGMVLVSQTLFWLAEEIDGQASCSDLAQNLSSRMSRAIDAQGVGFLVKEKLEPLGLLADDREHLKPRGALLALAGRTVLIPAQGVRPAARLFSHLFKLPVAVVVVGLALAMQLWLYIHGSNLNPSGLLDGPANLSVLILLTLLSAMFHELGHGAATFYGGASPGAIGAGLYLVWPAFFTETTDSYRLGRVGRLRSDLGGIYFNLVLVLIFGLLYASSGAALWRWAILVQDIMILQQLAPFLRLDGYYLVSDLIGVPDLFGSLRPALISLIPGRRPTDVAKLKPGSRAALRIWAVSTLAVLALLGSKLLIRLPSLVKATGRLTASLGKSALEHLVSGNRGDALFELFGAVLVALQMLGLLLLLGRAVRGAARWIVHFSGKGWLSR